MSFLQAPLVGYLTDQMNASRAPGESTYHTNGSMESYYANQNIALQREFAKNGVRWKVDDAKAAGIHPLYGIGAQGASFSPVSYQEREEQGDPLGQLLMGLVQTMGQNLLGSMFNTSTQSEREEAFATMKMENMELQNDLLRNQVLNATAPVSMGPPLPSAADYPIAGQTSSSVLVEPSKTTATSRYNRSVDAGPIPSVGWMRNDDGGYVPVMSSLAKERTEDDLFSTWDWNTRNRILPAIKGISPPPSDVVRLKPNHKWSWSPIRQAYYQELNRLPRSTFDKLSGPMRNRLK